MRARVEVSVDFDPQIFIVLDIGVSHQFDVELDFFTLGVTLIT